MSRWAKFKLSRLKEQLESTFRFLRIGYWSQCNLDDIEEALFVLGFAIFQIIIFIPYSILSLLICLFAGGFLKTYTERKLK